MVVGVESGTYLIGEASGLDEAPDPDVGVEEELQVPKTSHSSFPATGSTMSPVPVACGALEPVPPAARPAGGAGRTSAIGSPRRVTRMGRPVRRTRSSAARHVALNFEIAITSVSRSMIGFYRRERLWSMTMVNFCKPIVTTASA